MGPGDEPDETVMEVSKDYDEDEQPMLLCFSGREIDFLIRIPENLLLILFLFEIM